MLHNLDKSQPSSAAVSINGATKSYRNCALVLNGMDMTVPFYSIYGLLGSSGCGKTTLLSCILGQLKLDSGEIRIFVDTPEGNMSGVPGKNVGYMPQEMSFYATFTIKETVNFFGGLNGMTRNKIQNEYEYLANVLDLPDDTRKVETLSGGQQRRVSLAIALIHHPKLLILDEPTVGLDPLMRKSIGVMSSGRLLTEQSPSYLLRQFQADNLETIVLLLMKQAGNSSEPSNSKLNLVDGHTEYNSHTEKKILPITSLAKTENNKQRTFSMSRVMTLIKKNITMFYRNLLHVFFTVVFPSLMIYVVCISYGSTPNNVGLGVLNLELNDQSVCLNTTSVSGACSQDLLSCLFLKHIPQSTFRMKWMDTENLAVKATQAGNIWGYIAFPANFSESLVERFMFNGNVNEITWNSSQIQIALDETNTQISIAIKYQIYKAYEDFLEAILTDCGIDSRLGESSMKYRSPLYGIDDADPRSFFIPGLAVATIFFYPIMTTSIRLIGDKKAGVLRRSFASGVKTIEIILADIVTEFPLLMCQILFTYGIVSLVLDIPILGSPILLLAIFLLSGYAGASAGFLLATLCNEEFQATIISNAGFVPSLLISGVLWPVEGMSIWLAYIAPLWPCTLSAEAVRSIIGRGWDLMHPSVWPGLLVPVLYIIFFSVLNFVMCRHFRY